MIDDKYILIKIDINIYQYRLNFNLLRQSIQIPKFFTIK